MKIGQIELAERCVWCRGEGKRQLYNEYYNEIVICDDCGGVGYVLTEAGDNLLTFMKKFLETK